MAGLSAALRLILLALFTFIIAIPQLIILKMDLGPSVYVIPRLWHKIGCFLFRIRIETCGNPVKGRQVLYVGNHLSHFDIPTLGSLVKASFIAKEEVGTWPVMEHLSTLHQTAFISRSPRRAQAAKDIVARFLEQGKSLILFAEGTSTRGETVLPFKSSMFSLALAANAENLPIQPFTIELLEVDGKPHLGKELRDIYAWDRDNPIDLGPHCWNFLQTKGARVKIYFHEPVLASQYPDRKIMASEIREIVARPLEQAGSSV